MDPLTNISLCYSAPKTSITSKQSLVEEKTKANIPTKPKSNGPMMPPAAPAAPHHNRSRRQIHSAIYHVGHSAGKNQPRQQFVGGQLGYGKTHQILYIFSGQGAGGQGEILLLISPFQSLERVYRRVLPVIIVEVGELHVWEGTIRRLESDVQLLEKRSVCADLEGVSEMPFFT